MDREKLNNLINKIHNKGFDGMILFETNNISYISNYTPTSFAFCILKENPVIFTSKMDKELAEKTSSIDIKEFESFSNLNNYFKKENFKKIAIEDTLNIKSYKKLEGNWELATDNALKIERMIKTPDEITKIEKAADIAHKSFLELDIYDKQEKRFEEWETSYELGYLMRKNGGSQESFETIVASGANSSLPHATPSKKPLETPILIDWGCKFKGYCSDTSRTIIYTEKQEEIFDIVLESYNLAIKSIKPGMKSCEIDNMARSLIKEYGYENNFIHSTGHSLGLDIHESPNISLNDETIIEKGMVITVEPGIYLEGNFGVRIEDMIHVKNKGSVIGNLKPKID